MVMTTSAEDSSAGAALSGDGPDDEDALGEEALGEEAPTSGSPPPPHATAVASTKTDRDVAAARDRM
jgi:hypothetical protein